MEEVDDVADIMNEKEMFLKIMKILIESESEGVSHRAIVSCLINLTNKTLRCVKGIDAQRKLLQFLMDEFEKRHKQEI